MAYNTANGYNVAVSGGGVVVHASVTEVLSLPVDSSLVAIPGALSAAVTEVFGVALEYAAITLPVTWVDKPRAVTVWIDKG